MRTGLIARKEGMTRYFDDEGRSVPVTILKIDNCQVVDVRTIERDGYVAVAIGAGTPKSKNVNKAQRESYAKRNVSLKSKVVEFRIDPKNTLDVGAELVASHFVAGQFVDIEGVSTGKGFAGAMKRWNFAGHRASHGNSITHRALGSTGQRQDPGRVFKGKKMPGHLGAEKVTTQNLKVVAIDEEDGLILIHGSVPGTSGSWVCVFDAVKKPMHKDVPMPAGLKKADAPAHTEQPAEAPAAEQPAAEAEPKAE